MLTGGFLRSGDEKSGALGVLFCGGFAQRPFWSRTGKVHQTADWRGSMGTNKHRKLSSASGTDRKPMNEGEGARAKIRGSDVKYLLKSGLMKLAQ